MAKSKLREAEIALDLEKHYSTEIEKENDLLAQELAEARFDASEAAHQRDVALGLAELQQHTLKDYYELSNTLYEDVESLARGVLAMEVNIAAYYGAARKAYALFEALLEAAEPRLFGAGYVVKLDAVTLDSIGVVLQEFEAAESYIPPSEVDTITGIYEDFGQVLAISTVPERELAAQVEAHILAEEGYQLVECTDPECGCGQLVPVAPATTA